MKKKGLTNFTVNTVIEIFAQTRETISVNEQASAVVCAWIKLTLFGLIQYVGRGVCRWGRRMGRSTCGGYENLHMMTLYELDKFYFLYLDNSTKKKINNHLRSRLVEGATLLDRWVLLLLISLLKFCFVFRLFKLDFWGFVEVAASNCLSAISS